MVQLQAEFRSQTPEDKEVLMADLDFKIEIPALTGLALKADLCLPWKKIRAMKR